MTPECHTGRPPGGHPPRRRRRARRPAAAGQRAFEIPELTDADVAKATRVVERYRDQQIGITDASLVVLAARYRTRRILTLDRRHFTVLKPTRGAAFDLLP